MSAHDPDHDDHDPNQEVGLGVVAALAASTVTEPLPGAISAKTARQVQGNVLQYTARQVPRAVMKHCTVSTMHCKHCVAINAMRGHVDQIN